jgi:S-layer homology domain
LRSTGIITVLFLLVGGALEGQQTGAGASSISASLDTLAPPPLPATRPPRSRVVHSHMVVGRDEYLRRKASLKPRGDESAGPPSFETLNLMPESAPQPLLRDPVALAPTSSWEGIQERMLLAPPDPDIAVGPEDIIQVVNASIARFTRSGQQTDVMDFVQWYSALIPTVCPSGPDLCSLFDPSVRYDQLHGRFIIVITSNDGNIPTKSFWLISVSNGSTYSSGFKHFALDATLNGSTPTTTFLDYPQFGYDNNAVYLTGNFYRPNSDILVYAKIRILKKSELYNPATTTLTYQDIWGMKNEDNMLAASLRPAELRGPVGTGTPPGIFINASSNPPANSLSLWRVANPLGNAPGAALTTLKTGWTYNDPAPFRQKGSSLLMDPGDTRVLKAVMRNGVLYTSRNTGYSDQPTTVTYDRIDLNANTVTLQGRNQNGNFFYPAFHVPASQGPANTIPNPMIAGTSTDANGAQTYIGILNVKQGEDVFSSSDRWGDYFGSAIDPVQGGLWVFGEYAKPHIITEFGTESRWGTWTAYFPWSTSAQFTDVTSSSPYYDYINVMRQWSITSGCTPATYCPSSNVTRGQMAVFIIRAIMGDAFPFPATPYFTDVPSTDLYFRYIQKMRELGITSGCSATTYCPDDNVTRGQMAVFLVRGKLSGLFGDNFTFPQTPYFTDVSAADGFYRFVQKLRELGVTSGCTASAYCPNDPVTREQMAVFVVRAFLN